MVTINYVRLKADIVGAAVHAVNGTLTAGLIRAEKDVPVRRVFAGGRQTVRFKTAGEIEADKELRSRLGLGPEMLATPEALARVRAAGRNPLKSLQTKGGEFGFARTINRPSSDPRRSTRGATDSISGLSASELREFGTAAEARKHLQAHGTGLTRAQRGLTENRANRANSLSSSEDRIVSSSDHPSGRARLARSSAEFGLTARGRYELRSGRAFWRRRIPVEAEVNARTGEVTKIHYTRSKVERLGGGLRGTLRIVRATPDSYPVIEGWLVAGDEEHDYAIQQELGNRHNPAHPFLRPRLPEWRGELPVQLRRSLGRTGR